MYACIYASGDRAATAAWREVASAAHRHLYDHFDSAPGVLLGNTLHFLVRYSIGIIKFDLITQALSVVDLPYTLRCQDSALITTDEGGIGLATMDSKYKLYLWSSEAAGSIRDAGFVLTRVIDLEKLLPAAALRASPHVTCFADGARVVFMWTFDGLYSIGMKTEQIRRVPGCYAFDVVPYSSFYIPGRQQWELPRLQVTTDQPTKG
ncbi:uncharacterized protein LOC120659264 [Panicum virgatum]|uniref:uncharacterized protein LOC120659264 n=1 Tax=Panicum virgatum TaxID=38727 RepID=UPI0019D51A9F|nr:uncharacterized protein LOC120659264 [Panicum virgatum]